MKIIKLNESFFGQRNLIEILDKDRGYGIVTIQIGNIQFGIPLRSNLNHGHGFHTIGAKGLDYSKAVIVDMSFSDGAFIIPSEEYKTINDNEHKIKKQFDRYVGNYVRLVTNKNTKALEQNYRYTTLVNYHAELGLLTPSNPAPVLPSR